ncbi:very short patch repair endonuclease [Methanoculleus sediminis]|uniref:very short patch repair endonuclease n=1 Tax=Methanoculleus sediminis TaxID=1550566 RepID=UPI0009E47CA1|nr:very short patch repair endonuclease [Methanoculleus sediminis]
MPDIFPKEKRSQIMSKIKAKNTSPELVVRRFLYSHGFRYRVHQKDLPGKPDIVLPKYRTVIFVHGCFWHGHSCKIGSGLRKPKSNTDYWIPKIEKNIARDKENQRMLESDGWKVIVIWECDVKHEDRLISALKSLLDLKESENAQKPVVK